ncbi:MAG TPA: NAD(P)-dependent alcohol dehydrogenase [Chryseolinea sp.]
MKAYHLESFGSIDGIRLREQAIPTPQAQDVLVKIKAASINRRDQYILHQTYPLPAKTDVIPLSDGAGEVVAVGKGVTRFRVGDRVMGNYFARWRDGRIGMDIMDQLGCTLDGMLAEYAVLHEDSVVQIPANLGYAEASTLPCSALTAWSALANLRAGNAVLTIGSGGVSVFVIQFAKMCGAKVFVLTSRDEKIEKLKALGADHVLNYKTDSAWSKTILALTHGAGVNLVVETGGIDTLAQSVQAMAMGGEIALLSPATTLGKVDVVDARAILTPLFVRCITLQPRFVGSRLEFEAMNRAIEQHNLQPHIEKIFSFDAALDAYHYLAAGEVMGKIVITME